MRCGPRRTVTGSGRSLFADDAVLSVARVKRWFQVRNWKAVVLGSVPVPALRVVSSPVLGVREYSACTSNDGTMESEGVL